MKSLQKTINWNAHYTKDWSAESATNGLVDGGEFMKMLLKDHVYVIQCLHIYVVEHICRVSHKYAVENKMFLNIIYCLTEYDL